jgi:putative salt-induced outer membrane protein YdiY
MSPTSRAALAATALALLAALPARAQQNATPTATTVLDEKAFKVDAPGTYASADLSYVLTSGNSTANSLGFKGDVTHRWARHSIGFAAGGLRASSSPAGAYAIGTPGTSRS